MTRWKMNIRNLPFFRNFGAPRRGRLVRDYFLISVVLIGGGLITSGLVEIYFRYQEKPRTVGALAKRNRHRRRIQDRALRPGDS